MAAHSFRVRGLVASVVMVGFGVILSLGSSPGGAATTAVHPTMPPGYVQVSSPCVRIAAGQDACGQVTCPVDSSGVQTVPQGGGVYVPSGSTVASVNSSYPDANGIAWDGCATDATNAGFCIYVYAVCAEPNSGYTQITSASVTNPAGTDTAGTASCPTGTRVLGGGALASSQNLAVNMNSSYPVQGIGKSGWHVNMNNGSVSAESFTVYAVCSKYTPGLANYGITVGSSVDNPAGRQSGTSVACPTGTVPLGGGIAASSSSILVNINTTYPTPDGWQSWENNASASDERMTPYVICAS